MQGDKFLLPADGGRYGGDSVIVVDIFRASNTMYAMFQNVATIAIPMVGLEKAKQFKAEGHLVVAEQITS